MSGFHNAPPPSEGSCRGASLHRTRTGAVRSPAAQPGRLAIAPVAWSCARNLVRFTGDYGFVQGPQRPLVATSRHSAVDGRPVASTRLRG
jgi:hypothetical protein